MTEIKKFEDLDSLSRFAAEKFIEIGNDKIEKNGKFSVALAGGSTPERLYKLLASGEFRSKIDWKKVHFYFGDERNVLPDDDESNYKMANETIFTPLQISPENVARWQIGFGNLTEVAREYAEKIRNLPRFDLILLGLGEDAHTASLFPFTRALNENEKLAIANFVEKLDSFRLTLAFPVINNAANIIFLVSGANKADALHEVLCGDFLPEKFPAQNVKPENGNLWWLVDKAAAKLLDS